MARQPVPEPVLPVGLLFLIQPDLVLALYTYSTVRALRIVLMSDHPSFYENKGFRNDLVFPPFPSRVL